jgi:hypothetical protein
VFGARYVTTILLVAVFGATEKFTDEFAEVTV